ncbi:pentapeptide repeat-containing protein [Synechococcus elongatus]|uniref:pentapeptide repeat-containing protein n=1 Tax=Synechococcus elongatus TaxID=32046 RepID=UPI000F7DBD19|nr:pentapeptide repeat-containing protein [Synechococcus elongatus]
MGTAMRSVAWGLAIALWPIAVWAENPEDLQRLLTTRQCERCDLQDSGLVLARLSGARLTGSNLQRANLSGADLSGADLRQTDLRGASLQRANLAGANLTGARLDGVDLREAWLTEAILTPQQLALAHIQGAQGLDVTALPFERYQAWGIEAIQAGRFERAISYFDLALQRNPKSAPTYLSRAIAYQGLGRSEQAIADAQAAEQLYKGQQNPEGEKRSQELRTTIVAAQERVASSGSNGGNGGGSAALAVLTGIVQGVLPFLLGFPF